MKNKKLHLEDYRIGYPKTVQEDYFKNLKQKIKEKTVDTVEDTKVVELPSKRVKYLHFYKTITAVAAAIALILVVKNFSNNRQFSNLEDISNIEIIEAFEASPFLEISTEDWMYFMGDEMADDLFTNTSMATDEDLILNYLAESNQLDELLK